MANYKFNEVKCALGTMKIYVNGKTSTTTINENVLQGGLGDLIYDFSQFSSIYSSSISMKMSYTGDFATNYTDITQGFIIIDIDSTEYFRGKIDRNSVDINHNLKEVGFKILGIKEIYSEWDSTGLTSYDGSGGGGPDYWYRLSDYIEECFNNAYNSTLTYDYDPNLNYTSNSVDYYVNYSDAASGDGALTINPSGINASFGKLMRLLGIRIFYYKGKVYVRDIKYGVSSYSITNINTQTLNFLEQKEFRLNDYFENLTVINNDESASRQIGAFIKYSSTIVNESNIFPFWDTTPLNSWTKTLGTGHFAEENTETLQGSYTNANCVKCLVFTKSGTFKLSLSSGNLDSAFEANTNYKIYGYIDYDSTSLGDDVITFKVNDKSENRSHPASGGSDIVDIDFETDSSTTSSDGVDIEINVANFTHTPSNASGQTFERTSTQIRVSNSIISVSAGDWVEIRNSTSNDGVYEVQSADATWAVLENGSYSTILETADVYYDPVIFNIFNLLIYKEEDLLIEDDANNLNLLGYDIDTTSLITQTVNYRLLYDMAKEVHDFYESIYGNKYKRVINFVAKQSEVVEPFQTISYDTSTWYIIKWALNFETGQKKVTAVVA